MSTTRAGVDPLGHDQDAGLAFLAEAGRVLGEPREETQPPGVRYGRNAAILTGVLKPAPGSAVGLSNERMAGWR
jgi:hypothetical protein